MRLSSILRLYRARLRARVVLVQELFAILGIAVGVALLFASQVASVSLNGSVRALTGGIVGQSRLQLVARDPSGFDSRLLADVQRIPGVQAAVPVLEERAEVSGPQGEQPVDLIASDPRYAHLAGPLLRHFSASQLAHQQALALPTSVAQAVGVAPLQTVTLQVGAIGTHVLVGAELGVAEIGGLVHSPLALAPLGYVQQLAGMRGRITRILVRPEAGHDGAVRAGLMRLAAGHLNVQAASADAAFFGEAAGPINQATTLFSAISALVGFMFAYCAMLLTVPLRRGLVRDLRRDGATRWMTIKTLLFDAAVLGGVASLLGLVLGDVLSLTLFHSNPGYLSFAFPVGSQRIVNGQSIALAIGAGLLAACIGVLTPLRDIFSRPLRGPAPAARRFKVAPRALWLLAGGIVFLGVSTASLLSHTVSLAGAIAGIVSLVVALLLLLPLLLGAIIELFDRLQRRLMSGAARLAAIELRSPTTMARSLAIAATGAIAVFAGVTSQGATGNLQRGLDRLFTNVTSVADLWVAAPGNQNLLATIPLLDRAEARLSHLPGVRAVGAYHAGFLDYGERRVWVLAPPSTAASPIPSSQLLGGDVAHATALLRNGGWAVISQVVADQQHLHVGQSFILPAPIPERLRVAALSTNLGWPPGAIVLSTRDYVRGWGPVSASAYNVMLGPRASAVAVREAIHGALGPAAGLAVETAAQRDALQRVASRKGLERLSQIAKLVLIAGALAIAAAMSAMISQRRPQLARMKLEGFPKRGLWRSLILESALLLGAGCSIGAVFGVYGQLVLSHDLLAVTGFPVVYSFAALAALGSFALVAGAAAAIVAVPGYRAAGVRPYPV
ncbi:MAG TPA: FtsX-like permease family protein [Solirubrobacteraceae bacterium]|jgi:putative ABC transport system permease protein